MATIFETERLVVRDLHVEDAGAAFAIYGDPEVMRYSGRDGRPVPDLETMRLALSRGSARGDTGSGLGQWAVCEREGGAMVGSVFLVPLEGGPEVEAGWYLARAHWGRGYATEAARGALAHGLRRLGLGRVVAVVYPENERSLALCRRLDLRHEGRRQHYGHDLEYFWTDRV